MTYGDLPHIGPNDHLDDQEHFETIQRTAFGRASRAYTHHVLGQLSAGREPVQITVDDDYEQGIPQMGVYKSTAEVDGSTVTEVGLWGRRFESDGRKVVPVTRRIAIGNGIDGETGKLRPVQGHTVQDVQVILGAIDYVRDNTRGLPLKPDLTGLIESPEL